MKGFCVKCGEPTEYQVSGAGFISPCCGAYFEPIAKTATEKPKAERPERLDAWANAEVSNGSTEYQRYRVACYALLLEAKIKCLQIALIQPCHYAKEGSLKRIDNKALNSLTALQKAVGITIKKIYPSGGGSFPVTLEELPPMATASIPVSKALDLVQALRQSKEPK